MSDEIVRTDVVNVTRTMLTMGLTFSDSGVSARVGEAAGQVNSLCVVVHWRLGMSRRPYAKSSR